MRYLLGCGLHVRTPLREWWHLMLHHGCVHWSATRGENIACLLLWLLHHPGERLCCVSLCYGSCCVCCISQERIQPGVLTAYQVSFWPFTLHLAYHGFSEQCTQWDTARQVASQAGSVIQPSSHLIPQTASAVQTSLLSWIQPQWTSLPGHSPRHLKLIPKMKPQCSFSNMCPSPVFWGRQR